MYQIRFKIEGIAPLSQSRKHDTPYLEGESHEAYDLRTWRERCNYDENGIVFVPAMALKFCLATAAHRLAIPDPDNRRATLTKYFVSDVIPESHGSIGIHKDDMPFVIIQADTNGQRNSGKKVPKRLPQTPIWGTEAVFLIMEEKINREIVERVFASAGRSVGVGQFRPEKGGMNGRFKIVDVQTQKV